jgi:restriction endonuclease S subunit
VQANSRSLPIKPAGELFDIQLGKMLDAKRITGKYLKPYLGNANVQWARFELDDVKSMDFTPDEFEKFKLVPGDLLVCEGGEVGRTAVWRGEVPNCCYQKALHRLRPYTEEILPDYFQWFMRAAVESGLVSLHTATVTIGHFTAEKFEEFPVMVPPFPLQQKFVALVKEHERLRATHVEAIRQADHLFQTLLHQAFSIQQ